MKRKHITHEKIFEWLRHHPDSIHAPVEGTLDAVEKEVRHCAREAAWHRAIEIAHTRGEFWRHRSHAMHCPEDWAAREFCREFASDLRMLEPVLTEESDEEFVGRAHLEAFSPGGRLRVLSWVHDLAVEETHGAWSDVVRFTKKRAEAWIADGTISTEERWELTRSYADAASHAAALLERDYALRAHARMQLAATPNEVSQDTLRI